MHEIGKKILTDRPKYARVSDTRVPNSEKFNIDLEPGLYAFEVAFEDGGGNIEVVSAYFLIKDSVQITSLTILDISNHSSVSAQFCDISEDTTLPYFELNEVVDSSEEDNALNAFEDHVASHAATVEGIIQNKNKVKINGENYTTVPKPNGYGRGDKVKCKFVSNKAALIIG